MTTVTTSAAPSAPISLYDVRVGKGDRRLFASSSMGRKPSSLSAAIAKAKAGDVLKAQLPPGATKNQADRLMRTILACAYQRNVKIETRIYEGAIHILVTGDKYYPTKA